ncbi:ester cyclase [Ktedonobacteria bacterium brp13]|nr:ester cyclase [Ktedonobacteria bacterium brp13]
MSKESNLAGLQRFAEAVNTGNFSLFYDAVAPGAIDHDPASGQGTGPEGYERFFREFRTAFPDLAVNVEHLVADEDNIAFAYTITGTHKGTLLGFAPTGKQIKVRGMQIGKFENGKLVERWGSSDQLGLLQQLGVAPTS